MRPKLNALLLTAGLALPAQAQDRPRPPVCVPADSTRSDSLEGFGLGVTLDRYVIQDYGGATAFSLRGLRISPGRWGSEFGVGLLPVAGTSALGIVTDLGTTYQSPSAGGVFLLKFGATGLFGGGNGLFGMYGGAGVAGKIGKGMILRVDITRRFFLAEGGLPQVWLFSFGFAAVTPVRR